MNSISGLFKKFTKFGRIMGIETIVDQKVAFIEYEVLLGAFRASNAKRNPLGNSFIKIGYAIEPDPEELEALKREYESRKAAWAAKKEAEAVKELPTADHEMQVLLEDLLQQQQSALEEFEKTDDPVRQAELSKTIADVDAMIQACSAE
jgi:hypothetical protein